MPEPFSFADANASLDEAEIVLYGVPYDRTASFRAGARLGPNAIREASWNFETYLMDHGRSLADVRVCDLGNTDEYGPVKDMVEGVRRISHDLVKRGKVPIVLGGEHSIAPASVMGFDDDIGVLGIDAHLDFRDEYLGERFSHACSARRIADHVGVDDVVYMGVRSFSAEEAEDLERLGLTYVSAFDIHEKGPDRAVERALKAVDQEKIYLTIDLDGVDPAYAPAVGNPEPFGLTPLHVKSIIDALGPRLVGMDLNEVAPGWDHGQTALLAARLVREAIVAIGSRK
ncbi:MAG: agmatinase [Euryarchaeota archaeon]|nr:agmatinase [Euryarchaeota archaeon]